MKNDSSALPSTLPGASAKRVFDVMQSYLVVSLTFLLKYSLLNYTTAIDTNIGDSMAKESFDVESFEHVT
jgi:hypothetical protein